MHADRWLVPFKNSVRPDNAFLRALNEESFARLAPHLETMDVPNGFLLSPRRDNVAHLYFPVSCLLNLQGELADGATSEVAVISHHGFFGAAELLGVARAGGVVSAIHGGRLVRVRASVAAPILRSSPTVVDDMLRYIVFMIGVSSITIICQRHHSVEQRLARWLTLMRMQSCAETLDVTHDQLGRLLGVRREGVSETMKQFEHAGLTAPGRGHVHIIDPMGLHDRSCGCVKEIKSLYARYFPQRTFDDAFEQPARVYAKTG